MANKSNSIYKIIFLHIFFCFWASNAAAIHTLNQGDTLNSSASLVSKNGFFTLRFQNFSASAEFPERWYLALWYKNDDFDKPFWVANRDKPIANNSGVLVIDETGKLMIRYGSGVGSIQLSSGQSKANVAAVLGDDGNFVLKEVSSGEILWQSFDLPTDSFVPGMKLGINKKTGQKWLLTSWLTEYVPALGAFTLEWVPVEHQLIMRRRGVIFWTSGVLNNSGYSSGFRNVDRKWGIQTPNFTEVSNKDEEYVTYKLVPNQYTGDMAGNFTRLSLKYSGQLEDPYPQTIILDPDLCDGNNTENGCERWESTCRRQGDNFQRRGVDMDAFMGNASSYGNESLSFSDCKDMCWKNCNCFGVQEKLSNSFGNLLCVFAFGPLIMTQNGKEGTVYYTIIPGPTERERKSWIWILISIAATLIVILLGILVFLRWRRLQQQEKFLLELMTLDNPSEARELEIDGNKGHNLKIYSISFIMDATNSFSSEYKLGEGGFGPVYKGLLPDGRQIAIKRLSGRSGQGLLEFKNELILIAKLQHTNLVRLLGFCIHGEEKMLIYEYMPNKSLDSYIFDQKNREMLSWNMCSNIIEGIAQGLLYLHKYSRLKIIHRDLKASNILLDEDMNPKISDFGMAKIFTTQSEATNRIVGTYGYMSPEYAMEGIYSEKSDVFSFGVLVLEIVSGRKNNSFHHVEGPLNLIGYAWKLWEEGSATELMHPTLHDSCSEDQVLRYINVGLLCVEDNPLDRPTMSAVISMLTSEDAKLPMPKQPAFSLGRRIVEDNLRGSKVENFSANNVTISIMDPR